MDQRIGTPSARPASGRVISLRLPLPRHSVCGPQYASAAVSVCACVRGHVSRCDNNQTKYLYRLGVKKWFETQKRHTSREDQPRVFEDKAIVILEEACGEPSTWNTKKATIDAFKRSPMWQHWTNAGHNEAQLEGLIHRLKIKHIKPSASQKKG